MAMWEGRETGLLQKLVHEAKGVVSRARTDRRHLARDFSRLALGDYRSRERFAAMIARTRPKTPDFRPSDEARALAAQLLTDGYTAPLNLLTPAQAAEIREYFIGKPYYDPFRAHLGNFRYPEAPSPDSNQAYYSIPDTISAPYLLEIANHPVILQAAELILGCKPTIDNMACWWYFAERSQEKGFQRFHRDMDTPRFFKLFIYLTDTDERSGAQVYVKGSQRSRRLNVSRYINDDEVSNAFGDDKVVRIGGPAGTCFLGDVYGIHKGGLPIDRPRLMFAVQYNLWPSPFAPRKPLGPRPHRDLDPYMYRAYFKD
ncbi:MAG TPA: hypothetical protein VEY95_06015 [Azospirillaceae bacterium]|nr:hypothetical protein [Azospirillaceae bacterium]